MFEPVKCPPGCKYAMLLAGAGEKEVDANELEIRSRGQAEAV